MKYLVTGVKGQLGFDIVRELNSRGFNDVIGLDISDMDITDKEQVREVIKSHNPDVVFHCAAWTNVDKAEEMEEVVTNINVNGTSFIAEITKEINATLFYISTDYVFDGEKEGLYEIDDIPNPISVYGKTKYLGEEEAKINDKHFIVRISWVFGINGNNFIKTMLKLSETRNELNVVNDQIGSPTYTVDLASLLVDMSLTNKYGTYHANNDGFCTWADFARYIFKTNNKDVIVNGIPTSEYPTKSRRPLNSKLSKKSLIENGFKLLPTWQDAVDRYNLELKGEII